MCGITINPSGQLIGLAESSENLSLALRSFSKVYVKGYFYILV